MHMRRGPGRYLEEGRCPLIFCTGSEFISCSGDRRSRAHRPPLVVGTFRAGNPPSFALLSRLDLAPSPVSADLWEVAAAACGLVDEHVYHYWFEVTNANPKTPSPVRITRVHEGRDKCEVSGQPIELGNDQPGLAGICALPGLSQHT
jgi:hypothetical protein